MSRERPRVTGVRQAGDPPRWRWLVTLPPFGLSTARVTHLAPSWREACAWLRDTRRGSGTAGRT